MHIPNQQDLNNENLKKDQSTFNYQVATKALNDLSLDTFFNYNATPNVKTYPNIETFKNGFMAMNDKIYKEAKKSFGKSKIVQSEENSENCCLKKNHLAILESKKVSKVLKGKLRRSAMKYCHSQALIRLFKGYFTLMDCHHRVYATYPEVFNQYLKTVLTVFGSIEKEKIITIIKEVSINGRMYQFYINLYDEWVSTVDVIEKEVLLS